MNACERYEIMISALFDGELSERDKAELSAHIVGCERCAALAAAFAASSKALAEDLEEPPGDLHGAIMEKVVAAAKVKRGQARFMRLRPIIAAAACVAVVVVTLLAANHGIRMSGTAAGGSPETFAAAPEAPSYAGGMDGSVVVDDASDVGGENGGAAPMEAPVPEPAMAPADVAMDNAPVETRSMNSAELSEEAAAENKADMAEPESEPDAPAGFPTLEVEVIAAREDSSFTAVVLADPSGYFTPDMILTVFSEETVSPGTRVTVRYSGVSFGEGPGAYFVTAEEIDTNI